MKNLMRCLCRHFTHTQPTFSGWLFLLLLLLVGATAHGAAVAVSSTGYTNDFTTQAGTEWTTYSMPGTSTDIYAESNIITLSAGTVASALGSDTNNPPAAIGSAVWSAAGYLQTRPIGNRFTALMGSFRNNSGSNALEIAISYQFTI